MWAGGGALKEVGRGVGGRNHSLAVGHCVEELGGVLRRGGEGKDGGHVAGAVAVVWRGPHRHHALVEKELDALIDQLVRAADEAERVGFHELPDHGLPEEVAGAAGGRRPVGAALLGV